MSKFGAPEATGQEQSKDAPAAPVPAEEEEEEETLGQRRARLQAEAAARGEQAPQPGAHRPGLASTNSLADILSANPIDPHNQARKVSNEQLVSHLPQGSLLHQNVLDQERKKQQRLTATMRASSYGSMDPLLKGVGNNQKDDDDIPLGQKIQAYKNAQNPMMMNGQQRMSTMPQQGMMGMQMPMQMNGMQQPMMGQMGPMGMQMGMQQPGMMQQNPMMGMPMQMNGMGMQMPMQMNGMQMGGMQMPMGMNGMNMGMMQGGMMGPPMDPRQRDQIDRWMQGIRH